MAGFGDILCAIGDFGLFQKLLLMGLCYPSVMLAFQIYSLLFTQAGSSYHCNTDWILQDNPNLTTGEQLNLTVPRKEDGSLDKCRMFTPTDWDIDDIREHGLNETTGCINGWVYDTSLFQSSIVSEFDLVCDKAFLLGVGQTVYMAGILCGTITFGALADIFGRKRATQMPLLLLTVFVTATAFAPNLYLYMVFQFVLLFLSILTKYILTGNFMDAIRTSFSSAAEWLGVTKRSLASCFSQVMGGVGQCVMAGIAYFIRRWRIAQLALASSMLWIPESARWLLGHGRTEEANKLILMAASVNKRTLFHCHRCVAYSCHLYHYLFASPILRKYFLILSFAWFSLALAYNCFNLNVGNFGLNIFLMQLIFGLTDIPGHILCIWLLEALGRKISFASTLIFGGCISLLTLAFSEVVAFVTTGRVFMNWAGTICNVYIQELFPTSFRYCPAISMASIAYRVAPVLAPLVNSLVMYHRAAPTLVYGILPVVSGSLCLLLPETRRTDLPDTTEQLEERPRDETSN
uniref:Solute carrier family 22 member 13a n=1 Tax=Scleropages formosus TaxID=113540 RepID=A0A8C9QWM6_SCLFO